MKKKFKNVTAIVVCGLVLFSMNGCLRANSTEKEISDSTSTTAAVTDSSADSTASSDSTASTEKKDSTASTVDANESKKDTTAAADKKDSANSGDAKAESTDSAAADSTAAGATDSTPANTEAEGNTDSTAQAADPAAEGTNTATDTNVVGGEEIETPNAEGVSLTIATKDGNIDLEQGDKWSVSYDGGAAEDLDMKDPVDISEDTRSVKVTYPKDAVFYTLQASVTGKGNINSKGILSGNCYLGTESGSVNFATSAPLEEYNLFVSSSSGKATVNGEDASGADGYNNIGTTEKMVIVSSNTGDVTLTFNQ